ncbi:MAG: DNA polymerase III subunit delta [Anaerolineaceae bacterium]|nr:DNA polymerase III subunit delta [Anaerolineaceae bacterium]
MSDRPATTSEKPVVYILHGDDTFAMTHFVEEFYNRMGDPSMADLNTTRLDGRLASDEDLRNAAFAIPFLAERRLVVLSNPLARLSAEGAQKRFIDILDSLPDTTALVLLVEDQMFRKKWDVMPEGHWLEKWVKQAGKRAFERECSLPRQTDMPGWIRRQAESMNGKFDMAAAVALANITANDTRLANQEIDKLLTYVDFKRPVEAEDVAELCGSGGQVDIFGLVDGIADGNASSAMRMLRGLLEELDSAIIFGMITRQFRLLLMTREILNERGNAETIQHELGQHPYVAGKLVKQAERFSMDRLETVYHRLLELDLAIKTSQMVPDLAIETFIVELAR